MIGERPPGCGKPITEATYFASEVVSPAKFVAKFVRSKSVGDIDKFCFICIINFVVREERTNVFNTSKQRSARTMESDALHFVCLKII